MTCPACGLENPPNAQWCDCGFDFSTGKIDPSRKPDQSGAAVSTRWPIVCGNTCALLALLAPWIVILPLHTLRPGDSSFLPFLVPAAFGLVALVCGLVNIARGRRGYGVGQVALALICGFAGTVVGLYMGIGFDR